MGVLKWSREQPLDAALVRGLLAGLGDQLPAEPPKEIRLNTGHSNELAEVWYPDGRTLIVKRARYPDMAARFHTDHLAARLLRERTGVLAPDSRVVEDPSGEPVLVYWWIPHPTLDELWPEIPEVGRPEIYRDWGRLTRRIHQVRLPGHGPLLSASEGQQPLEELLREDLVGRLRREVAHVWRDGLPALDRLVEAIPRAASSAGPGGGVLIHGDLWVANIICNTEAGEVRCVGVLDLEDAMAGPPEVDLARTEILHGPLFGRPLEPGWFERVLEGYGAPVEPLLMSFFRVYHLLNMGYHAAVTGLEPHASDVARAAERELAAAGSGRRHLPIVSAT